MPKVNAGRINIHYETFGEGDPLLLIMGFGLPGAAWVPMLPLMPGFRLIYFDNRGTGESDKPEGPYTVPDMAEDASGLLDALGIAQAMVYGVSMGGMIAQELALRHPKKVRKLVLGCTTAGGSNARLATPEVLEKLVSASRMMASNMNGGLDAIMPLLFPHEFIAAHPEAKQMLLAGLSSAPPTPPETTDRALAGIMQFNAWERLPAVKCPVLIVHGESDILVPPDNAAILKNRLPQAEVMMIPGAGHAYQAADPIGIHQRIVNWLKS
jgi:pimeloyl-ACP methyl ester carboxylesterase